MASRHHYVAETKRRPRRRRSRLCTAPSWCIERLADVRREQISVTMKESCLRTSNRELTNSRANRQHEAAYLQIGPTLHYIVEIAFARGNKYRLIWIAYSMLARSALSRLTFFGPWWLVDDEERVPGNTRYWRPKRRLSAMCPRRRPLLVLGLSPLGRPSSTLGRPLSRCRC